MSIIRRLLAVEAERDRYREALEGVVEIVNESRNTAPLVNIRIRARRALAGREEEDGS